MKTLVRRLVLGAVAAAEVGILAGCDFQKSDVVARAGDLELTVERLGGIVAHGKQVPLRRDVVERMAGLWVDYSLVVQRLAAGDSLLDSATVVNTMWNERQSFVVADYHAKMVVDRVDVDPSAVDSAYNAGVERLIYHILVRTTRESSPSELAEARSKAGELRAIAVTGSEGWRRANEENEDVKSQAADGSLGLISRGGQVPGFEETAFSLAPGELSDVTESPYGFHVIWRPQLSDVWDEFEAGYRRKVEERMNVEFTRELEERRRIVVHEDAPDLMREAVDDPKGEGGSRRTIGTYLGGRFTVGDFMRWMQVLPKEYRAQVGSADDAQLKRFARGLMRNDVLETEALEAGYRLSRDGFLDLKETLSQDLEVLRQTLSLDSVFAESESGLDRTNAVAGVVLDYLGAITNDLAQLVVVRPALVDLLRAETNWEVRSGGVDRALARGAEARAILSDSGGQESEN